MRYAGLGIQLAASILIFVFIGRWLDRKTGLEPLFTILGAFLGFGGTMWSLIRQLNKENQEDK
jgi:ATP synthase protein I